MKTKGIKQGTRRKKLLDFIIEQDKLGRWPTHEEMREHMGWKNNQSVSDALVSLCAHGDLVRFLNAEGSHRRYTYRIARQQ